MTSWPAGGPGKVALPDPLLVSSAVRMTFKFAERVGESRTRETRESVSLHPPSQRRKVTASPRSQAHARSRRGAPYQCAGETGGHSGIHLLMGCDQERHAGHARPLSTLASRPQRRLRRAHSSAVSPPGWRAEQKPPASCHPQADPSPSMPALPPP